ncbi:LPXTG cell wall anchor domain-containing protein [Streptomyces halobius]|uniref:LPXTG cell wall anchor domain-containing protein n=1 Tax=Streptomyces halobius TaxID=2879846 RepID=A0ABY4M5C6_9ACTN|nr:LPXTG cell wall anchor domain-containing protein [Streptomyces halobius]UQA92974.1 LPXTG cell wall anchor domain-containing protein [Streptomyces halobius]
MRPLVSAGTLTAAVTAALLLAPSAYATVPGDNGTVKIHDAKTGAELRKNEPHVCTFYLDAFGFDAGQKIDWRIESWAPTAAVKGTTVASGSLSLDGAGHGRTQDQSLADGHYKLFWNFDGEHGRAKHKVFWTDCEGDTQPDGGKPSTSAAPSATSAAPSASSAPAGSVPTSPASSPSSAPSAQGGGDLAETGNGAPVGPLSAGAAALLAAGGYLLFRRRKAQQH